MLNLQNIYNAGLTLARTGGWVGATRLRFFADSEKTAALRAAGFGLPYGANIVQFLAKKIDRVRSGHGATGCPEKKDTHHFVSFFKARASIFSKLTIIVD